MAEDKKKVAARQARFVARRKEKLSKLDSLIEAVKALIVELEKYKG